MAREMTRFFLICGKSPAYCLGHLAANFPPYPMAAGWPSTGLFRHKSIFPLEKIDGQVAGHLAANSSPGLSIALHGGVNDLQSNCKAILPWRGKISSERSAVAPSRVFSYSCISPTARGSPFFLALG